VVWIKTNAMPGCGWVIALGSELFAWIKPIATGLFPSWQITTIED